MFSIGIRNEILIVSFVTPRLVAPPLSWPFAHAMHGGEYGSPTTWTVRSAQGPAGETAFPPGAGRAAAPAGGLPGAAPRGLDQLLARDRRDQCDDQQECHGQRQQWPVTAEQPTRCCAQGSVTTRRS